MAFATLVFVLFLFVLIFTVFPPAPILAVNRVREVWVYECVQYHRDLFTLILRAQSLHAISTGDEQCFPRSGWPRLLQLDSENQHSVFDFRFHSFSFA